MERIGDSPRRLLEAAGAPEAGALAEVTGAWAAAVGPAVARAAWPRRLGRDGTLHVATVSSTWAFELSRLAPEMLERLRAELGDGAPPALRFAPGPVPEPSAEPSAPPSATAPVLVPEPDEDAAAGAAAAAAIEDPELRALVARAAAASLRHGSADRGF